ncbi:sensor histidine kinase [Deinococcus pimensis]|uniref:sensor histidine kinase n=1 Tax=Deinococcus pimensis TaxID=309888 RepID=UPI00146FC227|nr:sensor histidine kinase [Deinococcus pimensis]
MTTYVENRQGALLRWGFYLGLLLSTLFSFQPSALQVRLGWHTERGLVLTSVGVMALLYFLITRRDTLRTLEQVRPARFILMWSLWLVLLALHPAFSLMLFFLAIQAILRLEARASIFSVVGLSVAVLVRFAVEQWLRSGAPALQDLMDLTRLWPARDALFAVVAILTASALTLYLDVVKRQNRERKALIDELRATRADLAQAERHAGVLEERERLARDLHDTLAQGLISIATTLEAASVSSDPLALDHAARLSVRTAREHLGEVRRVVWALRPGQLAGHSLKEALTRVLQDWQDTSGVHAVLSFADEVPPMHPQQEVVVLRVVQETLTNVAKHAHARAVHVTVTAFSEHLVVDVVDDGRGFDVHQAEQAAMRPDGGQGLPGLTARVHAAGGAVEVESALGEGTAVQIRLPYDLPLVDSALTPQGTLTD